MGQIIGGSAFQTLIGTVKRLVGEPLSYEGEAVSNPHRYGQKAALLEGPDIFQKRFKPS